MNTDMTPWMNVVLAAAVFIAGGLIGYFIGRASAQGRNRIRELEGELDRERDRHRDYQQNVAAHFGKSSDLFRDLTHRYTILYGHLAEGARDLCADRLPELGRAFDDPTLLAGGSEANGDDEAASITTPESDEPAREKS